VSDTLTRLAWALPLVLVLGVLAMLAIKRVLPRFQAASPQAAPMVLRQSLKLSDGAQMHLVALDGQSVLVVESAAGPAAVHVLAAPPALPGWAARLPKRSA